MTYVKEDIHVPSHACQRKLPHACTEQEKQWSYPEKTGQLTQRGHEYSKQVYFAKCLLWWRWGSASGSAAGPGKKSGDGNLHVLREMPGLTLPAARVFTAPTRIALYFQPNACHREGCLQMLGAIKATCRGRKGVQCVKQLNWWPMGQTHLAYPLSLGRRGRLCWAANAAKSAKILLTCFMSTSLTQKVRSWHWLWGLGELSGNTWERNLCRKKQVCLVLSPLCKYGGGGPASGMSATEYVAHRCLYNVWEAALQGPHLHLPKLSNRSVSRQK